MMNPISPERVRQDCRLIGQTLLKLALPRLAIRAMVLAVAAVVWLLAASWLLDFGRALSFDSLQALGQQTSDFLTRINPYVWWGVVVIWTLVVFFIVRGWLASDVASGRAKPVPVDMLSDLAADLSEEVTSVLRWVWGNREEPFTFGDLRQALAELRHSRIDKLAMVHEQAAVLDAQAGKPGPDARAPYRGTSAGATARVPRHTAPGPIEPRIGPSA